ncbi:MAG TPA: hypothetical protein VLK84_06035 [Longimicrobium sp.]|nr:hypothetical protein [Longimicrobium sp.]
MEPIDPSPQHPKNQGLDGPNAAKPLKLDMPFEDAVRRFMKAPPLPPEERLKKVRERGKRGKG